jgi:hypothetical protein
VKKRTIPTAEEARRKFREYMAEFNRAYVKPAERRGCKVLVNFQDIDRIEDMIRHGFDPDNREDAKEYAKMKYGGNPEDSWEEFFKKHRRE